MKLHFTADDFSLKGDTVALGMQGEDSSPIPLVSGGQCNYHVEGFSWSGQWVLVTGFVGEVLRSCWLGQFEERDNSNPFLRRLIPIVSGEALVLQDSYLASALYGLFHERTEQYFTLHIGTADVLVELERLHMQAHALIGAKERLVKAVLSLRIARTDLEQYAPGVLALIPEVLALCAATAVDRAADLRDAREAMEQAETAFATAIRREHEAASGNSHLRVLHGNWSRMFPESLPT